MRFVSALSSSFARTVLAPLAVGLVVSSLAACPAPQTVEKKPPPAPARTTFGFEKIAVTGAKPLWGSASVGPFVAGGVDATQAVQPSILKVTPSDDGKSVNVSALPDLTTPRMCNCALFDDNRNQLLVVGGRDTNFADAKTAEILDVGTGKHISIDANGAADHPVGCQAFFSKKADKGWIFGGLDSSSGFTSDVFRYDPDAHTLTKIDVPAGPDGRYDAAVHELDDGNILIASGMGLKGTSNVTFYQDLWIFHTDTETWTQVTSTTVPSASPGGRRYAWTSMAPDESMLLFGYGSDSPTGQHMLGDLWAFTFADAAKTSGSWSEQKVDGALPKSRGFTYKWQGPQGSAGVLAFGIDDAMNVFDDAYVMRVPDALAGDWH